MKSIQNRRAVGLGLSALPLCLAAASSAAAYGMMRPVVEDRSMSLLNVIILAIVQGLAELLPVSSSAHVVVAEKLLGLDPSSPPMTLLLVMLHTGTMFAVIVYFWRQWLNSYFSSGPAFKKFALRVIVATALTAVIGEL